MNTKASPEKAKAEKPTTPAQYLAGLPEDRRGTIAAIRETINAHRDPRLREGVQYGMIGWAVPHSVYPKGYHCDPAQPLPFASVASQKNHIGIYLFCLYTDEAEQARFVEAWKATGKRLDMGKSCIRVKKLEDVPLEVLGEAVARMECDKFIAEYEARWGASRRAAVQKPAAAKKSASAKTAVSKSAVSKTAAKKAPAKPASKKTTSKKPTSKKATSKKASSNKAVPLKKKASPATGAVKGASAKKPAAKKPAAKKPVSKASTKRA